ncbi:MAG: N-acetyltransferase, partial [Actinomycetales bacterium]|nr:N-acetyltransferase [Actinomycetales bacterium]
PFLHFETCYYAMIEYACQAGIQTIEPGAGGDHKYARGFNPVETWSLHHVFSPRMQMILERHLERERAQVEHVIDHLLENSALKTVIEEQ